MGSFLKNKDRIPDVQERAGYDIRVNGNLITAYSDPEVKDTDGDGYDDWEERAIMVFHLIH